MIPLGFYTYSEPEWFKIKAAVHRGLGRDADLIRRPRSPCIVSGGEAFRITGELSLRDLIENAASTHVTRSAVACEATGHKAQIRRLQDLQDHASAVREGVFAEFSTEYIVEGDAVVRLPLPNVPPEFLNMTSNFIMTLKRNLASQIAALERAQPAANTSKAARDEFWRAALELWIECGGKPTGVDAADFVIACSEPLFRKVRGYASRKSTASMPLRHSSVVEWLRLKALSSEATTS